MHFEFNIDDFDKSIARMKQMADPNVVDGAVLVGLREGGRLVQAAAKNLCPVDSGQLRNSIAIADLPEQAGVEIGSNVEYAAYVEYGTGQRGDPSVPHREDWAGMSPQPYLYPALDVNKENIANAVKNAVGRVTEQW